MKSTARVKQNKLYKTTPIRVFLVVFLTLWSICWLVCLSWIILNSFKSRTQYVLDNVGFPKPWYWKNYIEAFVELQTTGKSVGLMIWNSLWRIIGSLIIGQACTHCVAYCMARYKFPGRDVIYWIVIVMMILPLYGTMPANLKIHKFLGIYNNPKHLIAAIGIGGIMVPYAMYKNLPWSYAESAFIDGANHWQVFLQIMFPQMLPILAANAINAFISGWNDYMTSIVYMPDYFTLATGIYIYQEETARQYNFPVLFAAIIMSCIPVVLVFIRFQDLFMKIDISGGIKG